MKTLSDLLKDADPLGYEPPVSAQARRISRQAVLSVPRGTEQPSRRTTTMAVVVALALAGIVAGAAYRWLTADVVAALAFEVRLADTYPSSDGFPDRVVFDRRQEPIVTNDDIAGADVIPGNDPFSFNVEVTFTDEGAEKLARVTQESIGRPLAILVDGQVAAVPVIRSVISASAVITGNYTKPDAEKIASGIVGRRVSVGPRSRPAPAAEVGGQSGSGVFGRRGGWRGRTGGEYGGPRPRREGR
jgi:hypothetical protein